LSDDWMWLIAGRRVACQ